MELNNDHTLASSWQHITPAIFGGRGVRPLRVGTLCRVVRIRQQAMSSREVGVGGWVPMVTPGLNPHSGLAAALAAMMCADGLRKSKGSLGTSPLEQVPLTNQPPGDPAGDSRFEDVAGGVLGRVDLPTGSMEMVDAWRFAPHIASAWALISTSMSD